MVDFDVHHGNGTQDAFYRDGGVHFVSIHGRGYYPGTGADDETGEGPGAGTTWNRALPAKTQPPQYQDTFRAAMDSVLAYEPQLILVSAGFDAYIDDPLGNLNLEEEHFHWIGAELRQAADAVCEGRLVALLEGGYDLEQLGNLVAAFVGGVAGS